MGRNRAVEIPGTGIQIHGYIDRLDLAGDMKRARVIDYKTGRLNRNMADVVVKGGSELQRCLYAFAVKTCWARSEGGGRPPLSNRRRQRRSSFPAERC